MTIGTFEDDHRLGRCDFALRCMIGACRLPQKTPQSSPEFLGFDSAMRQLLTVSKQELHARIEVGPHKTGTRKRKPSSALVPASVDRG